MRSVCASLVALLLLPTISATDPNEARDELVVTLLSFDDGAVHVTWSAAPGAVTYDLYRGPTLQDLDLLASTATLEYTDVYAPDEDTWYVVVASSSHIDLGPMRGKCLAIRGLTGVSVTVANCMPMRL